MKTAIVYESTHHQNTLNLVQAIREKFPVDVIDVTETESADLTGYDLIGFAAGIAYGKFYPAIENFAARCLPAGKRVFFLYTCGRDSQSYLSSMRETAARKDCQVLGAYSCKGYDTFGPFKLVGGINKGRPNEEDIAGAVRFFEKLR